MRLIYGAVNNVEMPVGLCAGVHVAPLLREEASEHQHLTNADYEQEDCLSNGPVGDAFQKILGFHAVLSFTETVPRLGVCYHLQDLMDGQTCRFHLKVHVCVCAHTNTKSYC